MMRQPQTPDTRQTIQTIRATGARLTPGRLRVLQVLQAAHGMLSHHDIEAQLGEDTAIDRVTLYRVLDWLVTQGLASRTVDAARVFRFSVAAPASPEPHEEHAHFNCETCGGVFCLDSVHPEKPRLPRGFRSAQVALTVRGECSKCVVASRQGAR